MTVSTQVFCLWRGNVVGSESVLFKPIFLFGFHSYFRSCIVYVIMSMLSLLCSVVLFFIQHYFVLTVIDIITFFESISLGEQMLLFFFPIIIIKTPFATFLVAGLFLSLLYFPIEKIN